MQSELEQLRDISVLVADTGSIDAIRTHRPVDCTTNPSLVLAAVSDPSLEPISAREIEAGRAAGHSPEQVSASLTVAIGAEIAPLVPGGCPPKWRRACRSTRTPLSRGRVR